MITKARINAILRIWTEDMTNEALLFQPRRSNFKPVRPLKLHLNQKVEFIHWREWSSGSEFSEIVAQIAAKLPQWISSFSSISTCAAKRLSGGSPMHDCFHVKNDEPKDVYIELPG
jgi:hypothetical protein